MLTRTFQVHFHVVRGCWTLSRPFRFTDSATQIPKPSFEEGLGIGWPAKETDMDKLKTLFNEIKAKM